MSKRERERERMKERDRQTDSRSQTLTNLWKKGKKFSACEF